MKLKINKLLPYSEQNKKHKTPTVSINNRNYFLSPNPYEKNNNASVPLLLQFICTMPDQNNSDYQYLKCRIRVQSNDYQEAVGKEEYISKDLRRNDSKRDFLFEFVPPYRGEYSLYIEMVYKQKYFIQTTQPPQEKIQSSKLKLSCEDPFQVVEKVVYEKQPNQAVEIAFPLFVQYIVTNKLPDTFLQLAMDFNSQNFDYRFLNNQKNLRLGGGQTFYIMLEVYLKKQHKKIDFMFGDNGLTIGSFLLFQGKNRLQKKLFIKQGYKNILIRAETVDKKVVKKDIVQVKIKFINTHGMDYKFGPIKISIKQAQIPPGIKLLKISRDTIDLTSNREQVVTLTMICLRSGFFRFTGLTLNVKDRVNPKELRILKYINDLTLIVENEKEQKKADLMQRTSSIEIDSLI